MAAAATAALFAGWPAIARGQDLSLRLADSWRFSKGDVGGEQAPAFDDSAWAAVRVPHTWNADDAYSKDFYRGVGWYRRSVAIPSGWQGKRIFIRFGSKGLALSEYGAGASPNQHEQGMTRRPR